MPLLEALTIDVGASIAKSILKIWLKSDIATDASASIVDVLKSRTTDRLAQQRARQQFEKIGEKVGESLLPLFEIDGARLDDGSRTAVAMAVAETLNTATSDVLAHHNLEPANLAKHLLNAHPGKSYNFSDTE